jgi:hypothetical protein
MPFAYAVLMVSRRWILAALVLLGGHAGAQGATPVTVPVPSLLAPGTITVEMLKVALSNEDQVLNARALNAIKDRPAWYLELLQKTALGQPLPYDARFGVSEAEFRHLQAATPQITVTGCSTLKIMTIEAVPGQLYLRGGPGLEGLNGVSLRPASGGKYWVNTRIGTAGGQRPFTSDTSPLGVRAGYTWSLGSRRDDQPNNQFAVLDVARDADNRLLVALFLQERRDGQEVRKVDVLVRTANCTP